MAETRRGPLGGRRAAHAVPGVSKGAEPLRAGNKGVSPEVFWSIAQKRGIAVPKEIPATV